MKARKCGRKIVPSNMTKKQLACSIGYHTAELNRLRKELGSR